MAVLADWRCRKVHADCPTTEFTITIDSHGYVEVQDAIQPRHLFSIRIDSTEAMLYLAKGARLTDHLNMVMVGGRFEFNGTWSSLAMRMYSFFKRLSTSASLQLYVDLSAEDHRLRGTFEDKAVNTFIDQLEAS